MPWNATDARWMKRAIALAREGEGEPGKNPIGCVIVREVVAEERIAWEGSGLLLDVYHAGLIEPRPGGWGCWVLTEENQNGVAARAQALLMPQRMHRGYELWLTSRWEDDRPLGGLELGHLIADRPLGPRRARYLDRY
jgi:hypothetical protein